MNRYIGEHGSTLAIYKLTQEDYQELERVLTCEHGSREDYKRDGKFDPQTCGGLVAECFGKVMTLLAENGIDPLDAAHA